MERDPATDPVGMDVCATNPPPPPAAQNDEKENKDDDAPTDTATTNAATINNNTCIPVTAPTTTNATATATNATTTPTPSPAVEDKEFSFVYILRNYISIDKPKIHSPFHSFGGFKWRLLIFPKGNQTNKDLSVYLECGGPVTPDANDKRVSDSNVNSNTDLSLARHQQSPAHSWQRPAHFYLHLVHPSRWEAAGISLVEKPAKSAAVSNGADEQGTSTVPAPASDNSTDVPLHAPQDVTAAALERQKNIPADIVKDTAHVFRERESDWGFCEFASFSILSPGGHCDDDYNVAIKVKIRLDEIYDSAHNLSYDSRKQTGYVGFKNQGATCYMNSLLQTLYMLVAFRKAVYEMPLPDPDNSDSDMTYALQKVFYELQFSPTVVKTKKLTESFGWETTDAFTQHDVQELNRILCDHLDEKMKKTDPDKPNKIQELFQGKILNYIQCVDVDYKSTREESFYDLSLNVKGCRNIFESFDKYTEVENMDGENRYQADGFAELQRARKGVRFLKLPPVLQLHLKRFEYDFHRDAMVKINDRYEFDTEIDLSGYVEDSDGSDVYVLHSVLVHIGDVNGGHYHAFIRTSDDKSEVELNRWLKFDDEHVSLAKEQDAVSENFGCGGEKDLALITANNGLKRGKLDMDDDITNIGLNGQTHPPALQPRTRNLQSRRFMNAYMLQYIRKDAVPTLLAPLAEGDIPKKLADRISRERALEEQRRKDLLEQHLYMVVALATDAGLNRHHGADLTDWENCKLIRIKRAMSLGEFKMQLQNEEHIRDASKVRVWKCTRRQNDTLRPDSLVADGDDRRPMAESAPRDILHNNYMYNTRYNENYNEEPFRIFIEDLDSKHCFGVGESVVEALRMEDETKEPRESPMSVENGRTEVSSMDAEDADDIVEPRRVQRPEPVKKHVDLQPDSVTETEMEPNEQQEDGVLAQGHIFPRYLLKQDEVLLFFKLYIPDPIPTVQFLGYAVVSRTTEIGQTLAVLRRPLERFGVSPDDNLMIFEEQSSGNVLNLDPEHTLGRYQLSRGDVIVLQAPNEFTRRAARTNRLNSIHDSIPEAIEHWNFRQTPARNDDDAPLGGRPLPSARDFYAYLRFRVKVEFKDKSIVDNELNDINVDEVVGVCLELTKCDSYVTVRKILANVLGNGTHPDYLRIFVHDLQRQAPAHEPLRATDSELILKQSNMHIMTPHVLASQMTRMDYRVLWYERTEYRLSEFEHKEEVRVIWRWDGGTRATPGTNSSSTVTRMVLQTPSQSQLEPNSGPTSTSTDGGINGPAVPVENSTTSDDVSLDGSGTDSTSMPIPDKDVSSPPSFSPNTPPEEITQLFSVLVAPLSKYTSVIDGIRRRQKLSDAYPIRLLEVRHCRIERIIDPADQVPHMLSSYDFPPCLRAEPILPDETPDALRDTFSMVAVTHVAKQQHRGGRATFFGTPFLIRVRNLGMPVKDIREIIRTKMDVERDEFESWRLAEVLTTSLSFLNDTEVVWSPEPRATFHTDTLTTLAIEHRAPTPRRYNSAHARFADKPLKIRS